MSDDDAAASVRITTAPSKLSENAVMAPAIQTAVTTFNGHKITVSSIHIHTNVCLFLAAHQVNGHLRN